jgi:hypothetical protein
MTGSKDRELALATWLLREAGLEAAAELLARAWAEKLASRPAGRGRRRVIKAWLPRAGEWVELPADVLDAADDGFPGRGGRAEPGRAGRVCGRLGLSDSPPAGCMLEKEAEDDAKRSKT